MSVWKVKAAGTSRKPLLKRVLTRCARGGSGLPRPVGAGASLLSVWKTLSSHQRGMAVPGQAPVNNHTDSLFLTGVNSFKLLLLLYFALPLTSPSNHLVSRSLNLKWTVHVMVFCAGLLCRELVSVLVQDLPPHQLRLHCEVNENEASEFLVCTGSSQCLGRAPGSVPVCF